ncbi:thioredoxin-like protein [Cladochytrium replicatum]|nr:thioredoxin-like protein [Cladochytrium replicatum]
MPATTNGRIRVFFDTCSPYSYFAVNLLLRYRPLWNADLVLEPVLLGAIIVGSKNVAPPQVPVKGAYQINDLNRLSKMMHLPYNFPSVFPIVSLLPQRVLHAIKATKSTQVFEEASLLLMKAFHADDVNISDAAQLRDLLTRHYGAADADAFLAKASSPEIKATLTTVTNELIERGGFGLPTMFVTGGKEKEEQMYFGMDRIEAIAYQLEVDYRGWTYMSSPRSNL